jgi:hypothetical protein
VGIHKNYWSKFNFGFHITPTELYVIAISTERTLGWLWQSQFPWDSPRLSLHACNCGIFIGWCSYSPWATCIHVCHRRFTSFLKETLLQSSKHPSVWLTSPRITYSVYSRATVPARLLQVPRVMSALSVSQHSSCAYSPAVRCVLRTPNRAVCTVVTSTLAEDFDGEVYLEN